MSEATELLERMEHAAHSDHHGGDKGGHAGGHSNLGKFVGITMACLGVLLALCSAMVGAERTELIATMVEQTNTGMKYQAISTKYRMLVSQLTQLHALCPDTKLFNSWEAASKKLASEVGSADVAKIAHIIRFENAKNLNAEIPTHEDLMKFVANAKRLDEEREAAEAWNESFEPAVKCHVHGSEHYERAQLCCEVGIVVASIALLFLDKRVWSVSLILGATALVIVGTTFSTVRGELHVAEEKIEHAHKHYDSFNSEGSAKKSDEELFHAVEHDEQPLIKPE